MTSSGSTELGKCDLGINEFVPRLFGVAPEEQIFYMDNHYPHVFFVS